MKQKLFAMLPLVFSPWAHAHPGTHPGGVVDAIVHLLSEPDHLAIAAIAVGVGIASARLYRRRTQAGMQDKRR